jgi:2-dehydro-3-deoxygalactonokinase
VRKRSCSAHSRRSALATGRHLVCLPGTHTKWVSLHDGVVLDFLTVPTGELFRCCVITACWCAIRDTRRTSRAEFERGLAEVRQARDRAAAASPVPGRSLRIDKQLTPEGAPSWMSGLLIGASGGALPLFATGHGPSAVIGAPALCDLYACARTATAAAPNASPATRRRWPASRELRAAWRTN